MAAPLNTAKATVDLGAPGKRGSRIRRDPPAKARKEMTIAERDERDRRATLLGIAAYTLGMVVVLVMVLCPNSSTSAGRPSGITSAQPLASASAFGDGTCDRVKGVTARRSRSSSCGYCSSRETLRANRCRRFWR